jgi:hypothetical protein
MKIRSGFVSNSSSSSFIVKKAELSPFQHFAVVYHRELAKTLKGLSFKHCDFPTGNMYDYIEPWHVLDDGDSYYCKTSMDNFPLDEFLEQFGIIIEERWHS